jgi:hypothetical protein
MVKDIILVVVAIFTQKFKMENFVTKIVQLLFKRNNRLQEFDQTLEGEVFDLPAFRKLCFAGAYLKRHILHQYNFVFMITFTITIIMLRTPK